MEAQPPSAASSSSSFAYPRWVKVEDSSCSTTDGGDASNTSAAARTSTGHLIHVCLRLAEPPTLSRVLLRRIPDGLREEKSKVLAAHGNSVLIQICIEEGLYLNAEHFVYNAGASAAAPPRPPSLSLLPPYYEQTCRIFSQLVVMPRELSAKSTGLARRGEIELVVAELTEVSILDDDTTTRVVQLHLYLFRSGEWNCFDIAVREDWDLPSVTRDDWDRPLVPWDTVVPVDDRHLCWVDLCGGIMLCDVFEKTPRVQYVRLPMDPHLGERSNRNVCATAGGGALKFVNIFGRCCCGAASSCDCEHSRHAYTMHTWTMRIGNGDMEWVKDGMVDATELWALDAYCGLPCDPLDCPIVSFDEPDNICFRFRDTKCRSRTLWQIMVNMRSKTIHSISRHEEEEEEVARDKMIPSNVSYFFNTLTGQNQISEERAAAVAVDEQLIISDSDCSTRLQPSSVAELASVEALLEMFDALQEIPSYGLGPDEVKAYRILSSDNGRWLRSLLRLPKDLRKDWLLMEIKAADAN